MRVVLIDLVVGGGGLQLFFMRVVCAPGVKPFQLDLRISHTQATYKSRELFTRQFSLEMI